MKIRLEGKQKTPDQFTKDAWNNAAPDFWEYEEGKRAKLPDLFESFYRSYRDRFKNVLDVGCGSGKFLIPMVQDGLKVTGLDPADKMLEYAKKNLEKAKLKGKAKLLEGKSSKLDFPNESFDFVFAKGAIHHDTWAGIQQSFREVARVLEPGGSFLFQARSTKDSALDNAERIKDTGITAKELTGWKAGMFQHYFTKEELEQLAIANGFKISVGPEEIIRVKNDGKKNARWWVIYRKA